MNYRQAERCQALSAAYVLGTLRGPARRRFERLLAHDFVLRDSVQRWQNDFYPTLLEVLPEQTPPVQVWRHIEKDLTGHKTRQEKSQKKPKPEPRPKTGFYHNLMFWRTWAIMVTLMLGLLSGYWILQRWQLAPSVEPSFIAILEDIRSTPSWLIHIDSKRRRLQVTVLKPQPRQPDERYDLWLIPQQIGQDPIALGQLPENGTEILPLNDKILAMLKNNTVLAITLELRVGSTNGESTGPVLYQGKLITP